MSRALVVGFVALAVVSVGIAVYLTGAAIVDYSTCDPSEMFCRDLALTIAGPTVVWMVVAVVLLPLGLALRSHLKARRAADAQEPTFSSR